MVENGTDDNQDRIPFREQYRAMGHAVRANYLYAGVADVYAETGEEQLMKNLTSIWNDIVTRKMYVTGACGALYDGTSPDGTCYEPDSIQKVHQSYGRPYQLPNSTAHNETCANIGNMLFNWRMLEVTGDAKYAELVETCLYNSILSGISLDGKKSKKVTIEGSPVVALEGKARLISSNSWEGILYRPVGFAGKTVDIRLIPYYAWGNRGKGEMTVWMPLGR